MFDYNDEPVRNEALIKQVADMIEAFPETYDQTDWCARVDNDWNDDACGTTACIAGHAVMITMFQGNYKSYADWYYGFPGAGSRVQDEAKRVMGLTYDDSNELFSGQWAPHDGLSVPDALRKIAEGANIHDVSQGYDEEDVYED